MARRRRTVVTADDAPELANLPPIVVESAPGPAPTLTDERRMQELEDIIDEIGSESRIRIWQITDGKSSFAGEMSGDGFTLDALLDAYGGGDKTLVIYQGRVRQSQIRVSLDPSLPPKNPRLPKPIPGAPAPTSQTGDMMALMSAITTAQVNGTAQMQAMMTGIIGALTTVMTATKPTKDPTEIAIELAKVMRGSENGGGASQLLEMIKYGLDIGERIGGGRDEDDGVMTAVNKGLDTLGDVVKAIVEERKSTRALPPAPVVIEPPPLTVGVPIPSDSMTNPVKTTEATEGDGVKGIIRPWVAAARPYIGQLFGASKFMQPDAAAATIAHNLNDDQFFDLLDDIHDMSDGGFGVRLKGYFPKEIEGVDPNWIGETLRVLLSDYVDETEGEDDKDAPAPVPTDTPSGAPS